MTIARLWRKACFGQGLWLLCAPVSAMILSGLPLSEAELKSRIITLSCRQPKILSSHGLDVEAGAESIQLMPSGAGRYSHYDLEYSSPQECSGQGTRVMVFYPYSDSSRQPVSVDMSPVGFSGQVTPSDVNNISEWSFQDGVSLTDLSQVAFDVPADTRRAVAIHQQSCEEGQLRGQFLLFYDKSGTPFVDDYRKALRRYLLNSCLERVAGMSGNLMVSGVVAAALHHQSIDQLWSTLQRSVPVYRLTLKSLDDQAWTEFIQNVRSLPVPDSLTWRQRAGSLDLIAKDGREGSQALWSLVLDKKAANGQDVSLPGSERMITVDDLTSSYMAVFSEFRTMGKDSQPALHQLMKVIPAWKQMMARKASEKSKPPVSEPASGQTVSAAPVVKVPRSRAQVDEVVDVLKQLNHLRIEPEAFLKNVQLSVLLNSQVKLTKDVLLTMMRSGQKDLEDKLTTARRASKRKVTRHDSHHWFLQHLVSINIETLEPGAVERLVDSGLRAAEMAREDSPYRLSDTERQIAGLFVVRLGFLTLLQQMTGDVGKEAGQVIRLTRQFANMLEQWSKAGWLNEQIGHAMFQPCAAITAQLVLHIVQALESDAVSPWINSVFADLERVLSLKNQNGVNWVTDFLATSALREAARENLAHMLLHNWLVLNYLLTDDDSPMIDAMLRMMMSAYGHSSEWAKFSDQVSSTELVKNPLKLSGPQKLLRRNTVLLSRLLNRRLSKMNASHAEALRAFLPLIPRGNPLADLVAEKYWRFIDTPRVTEGKTPPVAQQSDQTRRHRTDKKKSANTGRHRSQQVQVKAVPALPEPEKLDGQTTSDVTDKEWVEQCARGLGREAYLLYLSDREQLEPLLAQTDHAPLVLMTLAEHILNDPDNLSRLRLIRRQLSPNVVRNMQSIEHAEAWLKQLTNTMNDALHYLMRGRSLMAVTTQDKYQGFGEFLQANITDLFKQIQELEELLVRAHGALQMSGAQKTAGRVQSIGECHRQVFGLGMTAIQLWHSRRPTKPGQDGLTAFMQQLKLGDQQRQQGLWSAVSTPEVRSLSSIMAEQDTSIYDTLKRDIEGFQASSIKQMNVYGQLETRVMHARLLPGQRRELYQLLETNDSSDEFVFTLGGGKDWGR